MVKFLLAVWTTQNYLIELRLWYSQDLWKTFWRRDETRAL